MKRKPFMIGVITLIIIGSLVVFNHGKKRFEHKSDLKTVEKIIVESDISNIALVEGGSSLHAEYTGPKWSLLTPNIDIIYHNEEAVIKVEGIPEKWMYMVPGSNTRGQFVLKVPPGLLDQVQIKTQNGNIHVQAPSEISRLSLSSNVGNIHVDSYKGERLNIDAKNGSIDIGAVDGEVNIKNQTGNLKHLHFADIKGKNNIKLSNGKVKITLPSELDLKEIGLNITTKNGKIISDNNKFLKDKIKKHGPGQEIFHRTTGVNELNISVSAGSIRID
ncbi:DUF4097 family beta strand repeat-containing protein [Cytobacillus purgationiresistens]|uniref:DUF4097 domain-containing protein n=1 Tax=Cytobacillus purgationiresistens TaxID=863449 RepID=A0ABU0AH91_9BACI|nr:DUF4097 family beta strand repeat-containing protein [Cytobacillus purgationiresistens]MDQ0270629.1 hypothetical protein [Cytobacillus purgationiresistens]